MNRDQFLKLQQEPSQPEEETSSPSSSFSTSASSSDVPQAPPLPSRTPPPPSNRLFSSSPLKFPTAAAAAAADGQAPLPGTPPRRSLGPDADDDNDDDDENVFGIEQARHDATEAEGKMTAASAAAAVAAQSEETVLSSRDRGAARGTTQSESEPSTETATEAASATSTTSVRVAPMPEFNQCERPFATACCGTTQLLCREIYSLKPDKHNKMHLPLTNPNLFGRFVCEQCFFEGTGGSLPKAVKGPLKCTKTHGVTSNANTPLVEPWLNILATPVRRDGAPLNMAQRVELDRLRELAAGDGARNFGVLLAQKAECDAPRNMCSVIGCDSKWDPWRDADEQEHMFKECQYCTWFTVCEENHGGAAGAERIVDEHARICSCPIPGGPTTYAELHNRYAANPYLSPNDLQQQPPAAAAATTPSSAQAPRKRAVAKLTPQPKRARVDVIGVDPEQAARDQLRRLAASAVVPSALGAVTQLRDITAGAANATVHECLQKVVEPLTQARDLLNKYK